MTSNHRIDESKPYSEVIKELRRRYQYIVAWGRLMGSYDYYVNSQVLQAYHSNAPERAVYSNEEGWRVIDDVAESTRAVIEKIIVKLIY